MNNVTKALAYLLVMSLLLAGGGFYYHTQEAKQTPTPTPTPQVDPSAEFIDQIKLIYQTAQQQAISESSTEAGDKTYCNVDGCEKNLNSQFVGYSFNIQINSSGNITKYFVTNGTYQFTYVGDGLAIDNINNVTRIADINQEQVITITPGM